jgi:hypothetical protein
VPPLALSALKLPHILQPLALAAGPTVGECVLTVAPSGLGYCDRVVGTDAAASNTALQSEVAEGRGGDEGDDRPAQRRFTRSRIVTVEGETTGRD